MTSEEVMNALVDAAVAAGWTKTEINGGWHIETDTQKKEYQINEDGDLVCSMPDPSDPETWYSYVITKPME